MDVLKDPDFKRSQTVKSFCIAGADFSRIAYGYERGAFAEYAIETECSNCGAPTGFLHLLPCDLEQCPRCEQQALGCSCDYEKRPDEL
jgi:hypothetical protein